MSHISTYIGAKITNVSLLLKVAKAKGYEVIEGQQIVRQFGSNAVECVGSVKLTGWRYPIAITESGELKYDHFGSMPNTMDLLGNLVQRYNEEVVSQSIDYSKVQNFYKEKLPDGNLKLVFEY